MMNVNLDEKVSDFQKIFHQGFTLTELLVVLILLGLVAGFAIPEYGRVVDRGYQQDALDNLRLVHAANLIYMAEHGEYWPQANGNDLAAINRAFGSNIIANGMTYNCDGDGTNFSCTASRGGMVITVTDADVQDGVNPVCTAGCP